MPIKSAREDVEEIWVVKAQVCKPILLSKGDLIHELVGQLRDHLRGEVTVVKSRLSHGTEIVQNNSGIKP